MPESQFLVACEIVSASLAASNVKMDPQAIANAVAHVAGQPGEYVLRKILASRHVDSGDIETLFASYKETNHA